ncbi:glycosyltransferase [Streptomyces sp. HB132]|uniref:glycosyltransferase n=1 Tax=Streptomyces sp. HB132 TaxID=767388 RepID=UPI001E180A18|nr:glycosyltransferase [Streptomyces sp. HB132]MBM7441391.1 cellulose synthase/poly-beta-1,6-N-acetylglucosamine synthase-like glycosyltransferase [Streptomyces sp. HB132]
MPLVPAVTGLLLLHVLWPTHWTRGGGGRRWLVLADSLTLVSVGLVELFLLANLAAVAYALSVARDPVPVTPEPGRGLAFLTTYVPGREPLSTVRAALEGAVRMRHPGPLDVWLLDEGDDPEARMLCAELGVHHFTRLGVPEWNQETGPHKAGTKHGNVNAWLAKHGDAYDFVASVDSGHVPRPESLERMTGYFRDPDIAFVVGPRVHGGEARAAGSSQLLSEALAQLAGNRYGAPLFDGTDKVARVAALRQAGGFHGSATEALATGFAIHRLRNPLTGRHWRSVHTADARAAGERPVCWADRSTRRPRRFREAYGTLLRQYGRALFRVRPGRLVSYTLTLVRRPVEAATRLFGVLSCVLVLTHTQSRVWALLALVTALVPLVPWSLTPLRRPGTRGALDRSRTARPVPEPEPALAATAGASPPPGGN